MFSEFTLIVVIAPSYWDWFMANREGVDHHLRYDLLKFFNELLIIPMFNLCLNMQMELERREVELRAKREEEERKRLEEALRARQEEERKRLEEEELARQKQVDSN